MRDDDALFQIAKLIAEASDGAVGQSTLAAIESDVRPGEMPPLHVHETPEAFAVTEGSLILHVGELALRLEAGESYLAPAGVPHTYAANLPRTRFVATAFVVSVGRYEDFLRAVAHPGSLGEEAAGLGAIAAVNGITVLGPPGSLPAERAA
jgi:quercetin dioxygenase-like cupin family protein